MSAKNIWVVLGALVVGLLAGAGSMAALSARASSLFLQEARFRFATESADSTKLAYGLGNWAQADIHAACLVALEAETRTFDAEATWWTPGYSLSGLWVTKATRYPVPDRKQLLALSHARRGAVMEAAGRRDDAGREYALSVKLTGNGSVASWREAGKLALGGK